MNKKIFRFLLLLVIFGNCQFVFAESISCSWVGFNQENVAGKHQYQYFNISMQRQNEGEYSIEDGIVENHFKEFSPRFGSIINDNLHNQKELYEGKVIQISYLGTPLFRYYKKGKYLKVWQDIVDEDGAKEMGWSTPRRICNVKKALSEVSE